MALHESAVESSHYLDGAANMLHGFLGLGALQLLDNCARSWRDQR
jgi:hypothetical protein